MLASEAVILYTYNMNEVEHSRSSPLDDAVRARDKEEVNDGESPLTSQHGVRGVCPVVETPFDANGDVDEESLKALMRHLGAAGVPWVMYPGFASEHLKLTDAERDELSEAVVELAHAQGMRAVASVSDHGTLPARRRAQRYAEMGADAINILPPYQLSPDARSIVGHLEAVLDAVEATPAIVQIAPALTGSALNAASLGRIALSRRNFLQVKVESIPPGRIISELASEAPSLSTIVGYAGLQLPDALRRGAIAVQPGSSFVELYLSIWKNWHNGSRAEALELHGRMVPYLSYWMQNVELIVAAEKRVSLLRGIISTDACRQPGWSLDAEERNMIDSFLDEFVTELTSADLRGNTP